MTFLTSFIYGVLKNVAVDSYKAGKIEESVTFSDICINLAYHIPFGKYNHNTIEYMLEKISQTSLKADKLVNTKMEDVVNKSIIYISPKLTGGGGYQMMNKKFIDFLDNDVNQIVINTQSSSTKIDPDYIAHLRKMGASIINISDHSSPLKRAQELFDLIRSYNSPIIFNFSTKSVVDYLALIKIKKYMKTPIFWFNIGDYNPILGLKMSDYWVEYRRIGITFSKQFRGINKLYYLPLPIPKRNNVALKKKYFGIPNNSSVSVTVTPFYKLINDSTPNYFDYLYYLLKKEENHYHILICPGLDNRILNKFDKILSKRLILLGYREDLDSIFQICDFGIESFPMFGGIVRKEMINYSLPFINIRNHKLDIFSLSDEVDEDYPLFVKNLKEFEYIVSSLIHNTSIHTSWKEYIDKKRMENEYELNKLEKENIYNINFMKIHADDDISTNFEHDVNKLHNKVIRMRSYLYEFPIKILIRNKVRVSQKTMFNVICCVLGLFFYRLIYLRENNDIWSLQKFGEMKRGISNIRYLYRVKKIR